MDPQILTDLRDHLNELTQPGKPYQVGPGIGWSFILPKDNFAEDLRATLSSSSVRTWVGVIVPSGSRNAGTSRQQYGPDQPRGGAFREMNVYLTVFLRSLKQIAYDGNVLLLEDLMQEIVGDFSPKNSKNALVTSVGEMQILNVPPDFLAFEFAATIKYSTASKTDAATRLRELQLDGNVIHLDVLLPPT